MTSAELNNLHQTSEQPIDTVGWILIGVFFSLLAYAGYLSYKSIDWNVLKKLESVQLILPTPITASPSTPSAAPATTPNP